MIIAIKKPPCKVAIFDLIGTFLSFIIVVIPTVLIKSNLTIDNVISIVLFNIQLR